VNVTVVISPASGATPQEDTVTLLVNGVAEATFAQAPQSG
jgi:hypothetical protein